VRELRNYLERSLVLREALPLAPGRASASGEPDAESGGEMASNYYEGRRLALDSWERLYLAALLDHSQGNVEQAATAAGVGRAYMYRLAGRHRLLRRKNTSGQPE
jgi:DNA-binding NtrC family response regulator